MAIYSLVVLFAALLACTQADVVSKPGAAVTWSRASGSAKKSFHTTTMDNRELINIIKEQSTLKEITVLLSSDNGDATFDTNSHVMNAVRHSDNDVTQYPYVYQSSRDVKHNHVRDELTSSNHFASVAAMSMTEFGHMMKNSPLLSNGKPDLVSIKLSSTNIEEMSKLIEISNLESAKDVLFVAVKDGLAHAPSMQANYHRMLDLSNAVYGEPGYLPEGTEFTIWYNNQYLYLTPDIFTGIMTMLFIAYVLWIGIGCIGDIQGPGTFASKLPTIGKEG